MIQDLLRARGKPRSPGPAHHWMGRGWIRRIGAFEIGPDLIVVGRRRRRLGRIDPTSEPTELRGEVEEAGKLIKTGERMRVTLLVQLQRLPPGGQPIGQLHQQPIHLVLDGARRQRRQTVVGIRVGGVGRQAINPIQGGQPEGHPLLALGAMAALLFDNCGIKKPGRELGKTPVAAKGATERGQSLRQFIRAAPARNHAAEHRTVPPPGQPAVESAGGGPREIADRIHGDERTPGRRDLNIGHRSTQMKH